MAESTRLGSVSVKLFAQIGDGDQYEIGSVIVPLTAKPHGKGLLVDLETPFEAVGAMVKRIFADTEENR